MTASPTDQPVDEIIRALQERAKELHCLYHVDEILGQSDKDLDSILERVIEAIPPGWQYPGVCAARLTLGKRCYEPAGFEETPWVMAAPIRSGGETVGELEVYYTEEMPDLDEGPFLKEERRLIDAIGERVGNFLMHRRLTHALRPQQLTGPPAADEPEERWSVVLEFLRGTDRALLARISRRMINYLFSKGVGEAGALLRELTPPDSGPLEEVTDENQPLSKREPLNSDELAGRTFELASTHLSEKEVLTCIQNWIREENSGFLYAALENPDAPFSEVAGALERFHARGVDELELRVSARRGLVVALLRRFFSGSLEFINSAKTVVRINDFYELVKHTVYSPLSYGKLGGKSAGLFVAARAVRRLAEESPELAGIRVPRTWYIASDGLLQFIRSNSMEDFYDLKYREIDQIRQEYPYLVQVFKSSPFPPELSQGFSALLDDLSDSPIIVRSSSLLEDRVGSTFSGKYKSLFLSNQGSKQERQAALEDAVAEIYASVFGPDPIHYRAERGLLDVHEEMGIMVQEVVGNRVGKYYLPAFSGVALSNNEFRWSSRIKREDGLVRLVPGLGTRAVDRLSNDYPVLVAPGQPGLRVNSSPEEVERYSPRGLDLINLETNAFETVEISELFREVGPALPMVHQTVSAVRDGQIRKPLGTSLDFVNQDYVVTFEGLLKDTPFVARVRALLEVLQRQLGVPVDVEFASDGEDFYLLQCRAQGQSPQSAPAAIPRDLPRERLLFTADRFVSNGRVPAITHIVYIDHASYHALPDFQSMREVGTVVGRLNNLLPRRQFILMGPGRWGSRGDIKLGVSVGYSQINNTAVLVEMAWQRGNYAPDLSFGTHFFQDLVEAEIRYLPLYPDDANVVFNEAFLLRSRNLLPELVPGAAHLAETIRVIDIPAETDGRILRVLMNADLGEAVGILSDPSDGLSDETGRGDILVEPRPGDHWRWRLRMAERIAGELDGVRFGVKGFYVFGSTKNATAGPGSDLDVLVHFGGGQEQRADLSLWLDGWSLCLAEMNYLRTGYRCDGLLDVHWVTDEDIAKRTSFAVKIGAVTDAARPLPLAKPLEGAAGQPS